MLEAIVLLVSSLCLAMESEAVTDGETRFTGFHGFCALDAATSSSAVRSQLECSGRCSRQDNCTGFNFRKNNNEQPQPVDASKRADFQLQQRLDSVQEKNRLPSLSRRHIRVACLWQ